jgi:hypothetical protein
MSVNKLKNVAGITIPDSAIATQATDLLLTHGNEFIYNHSLRVFIFGCLSAQRTRLDYDAELLYVSAVFHDLGLTPNYSSPDLHVTFCGDMAFRRNHFSGYGTRSLYIPR